MTNRDGRKWAEEELLIPLGDRLIQLGVLDDDTRTWTIKWEDYNNE